MTATVKYIVVCLVLLFVHLPAWSESENLQQVSSILKSPQSLAFGYFNLQVVISAGFEDDPEERKLREEADQQLRDKVNKFNDDLKKMIAEGCPKVEINEFIRQKTEELRPRGCGYGVPLKQPKPRFSNKDISLAVKRVAQRLKLDVVLDSNRIFYGGQSLVNGAMDITHDVVNELITTTKR